jgi:hypothetical protein
LIACGDGTSPPASALQEREERSRRQADWNRERVPYGKTASGQYVDREQVSGRVRVPPKADIATRILLLPKRSLRLPNCAPVLPAGGPLGTGLPAGPGGGGAAQARQRRPGESRGVAVPDLVMPFRRRRQLPSSATLPAGSILLNPMQLAVDELSRPASRKALELELALREGLQVRAAPRCTADVRCVLVACLTAVQQACCVSALPFRAPPA